MIRVDICDPISLLSHSNKRQILSFIDDYSFISYMINPKHLLFSKVSKFEKESGAFFTGLKTNRRAKFTSQEFVDFRTQEDISWQFTTTYTPQ